MIFSSLFKKEQKEKMEDEEKLLTKTGEFESSGKHSEKFIKYSSREKNSKEESKTIMIGEQKDVTLFYVEELHKEPVRVKHVQELATHQLPIKAIIPGDDRSYFTIVEKVVITKEGYAVLLKEFENPKYKEKLKVGTNVKFEYSDMNGKFSFESTFKGVYKGSLVFTLPQKIDRVSGRAAFRAKPDPAEPIEVALELPQIGVTKCNLVDINEYGMGVDVQIPKDKLKVGLVAKVAFRIPIKEGQKRHEWPIVSAEAEIRFIGDAEGGKIKLGLQFTKIEDDDRKNVRDYWLMRQRQELRRKLEYEG